MIHRPVARTATFILLALLGGAVSSAVLWPIANQSGIAIAAEPPSIRRSNLVDLTGLRVVLVLRADWLTSQPSGIPVNPAANALGRANAVLFCRIDQVHPDWVEVSTSRLQGDAGGQLNTTRDVWLIRNDAIVAIQTAEADR